LTTLSPVVMIDSSVNVNILMGREGETEERVRI